MVNSDPKPSTLENQMTLKRVLNYVNGLRKTLGKKPLKNIPKGLRMGLDSCPIAIALDVKGETEVVEDRIWVYDRNGKNLIDVDTPSYIQRFITDFDNGKYPKLIGNEDKIFRRKYSSK